jgi:hypothetical protein
MKPNLLLKENHLVVERYTKSLNNTNTTSPIILVNPENVNIFRVVLSTVSDIKVDTYVVLNTKKLDDTRFVLDSNTYFLISKKQILGTFD